MLYEHEKTRKAALRELNQQQHEQNRFTEITENTITEKVNTTNFEYLVLTDTEYKKIENMISYYDFHKVERIQKKHPGFVTEDFNELLAALKKIMEL